MTPANDPGLDKFRAQLQEHLPSRGVEADAAASSYHGPVNDVTREEIDAKLQAVEARMDARLASIEGKFDLMFHRLDTTNSSLSNLRWWVAGAAAAIFAASIATGVAIQQMTVSTFQAALQQIQAGQQAAPSAPPPRPAAK